MYNLFPGNIEYLEFSSKKGRRRKPMSSATKKKISNALKKGGIAATGLGVLGGGLYLNKKRKDKKQALEQERRDFDALRGLVKNASVSGKQAYAYNQKANLLEKDFTSSSDLALSAEMLRRERHKASIAGDRAVDSWDSLAYGLIGEKTRKGLVKPKDKIKNRYKFDYPTTYFD